MAQALRIDVVSDVACPWCAIGLRSLYAALARLGDAVEADIRLQPFELNPDMGPEGENTAEHVARKYGSSVERSMAAREAIRAGGEAVGFTFNFSPDSRIWNTFDAHRLLHWAAIEGRQLQLKDALFTATFTDQRPTNDPETLVAAAAAAGLDPQRARAILSSAEFAAEVRRDEAVWRQRGIQAVPSVILNERWLIQGAQSPQVFEQAIRDIVSGNAKEA